MPRLTKKEEREKARGSLEAYERAVALACEVCTANIKDAHQLFVEAKKSFRRTRDGAIQRVKEEYQKEIAHGKGKRVPRRKAGGEQVGDVLRTPANQGNV